MDRTLFEKIIFSFFLLFLAFSSNSQTFIGPGTNWNTASNWSPSGVPSTDISGTITINSNVNVSTITVKNGGELIVNSPAVLTVGTIGNSATTQVVDFQNGSKVTINTGSSMIVYGLLNNSNNSNNVKFDGAVNVTGNVTVGNGSTVTGTGSLSSTGTVTGAGTVFGTGNDCTSGDGCNYGCSVNTISTTQTICSGTTATLTGNTGTGYSYKWQSSTTSSSTGFSDISGATGNNYTTSALTTTTYFRRIVTVSGCSSSTSNVITVTVTPLPAAPTSLGGWSPSCNGYVVSWNGSATKFYLDVSTTNTFDAGTILSAYNNKDVGNVTNLTLTGLAPATTYYFRVRAFSSSCPSNNSSTGNFTTLAVAVPTNARAENANWCSYVTRWDGSATKFYLDVATSNTFSAGTILPAYNNLDVGNTNNLTLSGLSPNTTYYFRVRRLEACGLSGNSSVVTFTTLAIPVPTANTGYANCNDWMAQWGNASVDGYYLDVARDNAFTNFVGVYQNLDVGNVISYNLTGLTPGGTYYYRVRAKTSCGFGGNSNVVIFTEKGNNSSNPGTISGGATTVCVGSSTPAFINTGSNPSSGTWSIFNESGAATITSGGVVTGTAAGVVSVVYTVGSGCVSSTTTTLTVAGGTVSAGSTSTVCVNTALTPITHTANGFTGIGTPTGLPAGTSASFASNTVTISGTPTTSGTYNYTIPVTGSCGTANATGTITVSPNVGNISLNGTPYVSNTTAIYCPSSTAVFTIASGTGINWNYPAGWTYVSGQGTTRLEVITGSTNSTSTVSVTVSDPQICASYLKVTTSSVIDTPTEGTKTNVICPSLGSVVLNSLPSSGTWILQRTGGSPVATTTTTGSGSQTTVSNLAVGSYTFKVSNSQGCTSSGLTVTIIDATPTATWSGGAWVGGIQPASDKNVVFDDHYIITSSALNSCTCTINSGKNVVVGAANSTNANAVLTVIGDLNVAGTLTFENNASLVQVNDNAVNTGNIIYKRNTSLVADFDYVYWGSPVKNQQLNVLSPNSDKYYSYWNGAWVLENGTAKMDPPGKGYIIRVPRMYTTYSQAVQFEGVPNNGEFGLDVVTVKSNLLGNPYPSAIDADDFMTDSRNSTKINGGLYFWTHNSKRQQTGSQFIYAASDYAVYNLSGWTGATSSVGVNPDSEIAAGQSFFVPSLTAGKLYFTNLMRISASGKNSNFFRPSDTKKAAAREKNRVWLNLTNDGGAFKQLLVGYITGATNGADNLYDAETMNGNAYVDFYSVNNSKNYTIQGRGLPFDTADEVALGYQSTIAGTFQIGIDKVDGSLVNQAVYLEDKTTHTVHNLKSGAYSFTTEVGSFNDRFVLRYTNTSKLGVDDVATKGKGVIVSVKNSQIKINSFDQSISSVMVYDLKGSLLYEKNKIGTNEFTVDHLTSASQFMIVMTQLEDGKWVSEEIIFHD